MRESAASWAYRWSPCLESCGVEMRIERPPSGLSSRETLSCYLCCTPLLADYLCCTPLLADIVRTFVVVTQRQSSIRVHPEFKYRTQMTGGWVPTVCGSEVFNSEKNRQLLLSFVHSEVTLQRFCGGCSPVDGRNFLV